MENLTRGKMYNKIKKLTGPGLRVWCRDNPIDKQMLWLKGAEDQVDYFEKLAPVLIGWKRWNHDDAGKWTPDEKREDPDLAVVSTHRSKSIILPVVRYRACDGHLIVLLRDNFYDYSATFFSDIPLHCNFFKLPIEKIQYGFEGFKADWIKDVYQPGAKEFSVQATDEYNMWTICFLVRSFIEEKYNLNLD